MDLLFADSRTGPPQPDARHSASSPDSFAAGSYGIASSSDAVGGLLITVANSH
jgi:hypothetical protein